MLEAGRDLLVGLGLLEVRSTRPPQAPTARAGVAPPPRALVGGLGSSISIREPTEELEEIDLDDPETNEEPNDAAPQPAPLLTRAPVAAPRPLSPPAFPTPSPAQSSLFPTNTAASRPLSSPAAPDWSGDDLVVEDIEVTELEVSRRGQNLPAALGGPLLPGLIPRPPRSSEPIARGLVPDDGGDEDDDDDEDLRPTVVESWREFDEERATLSEFSADEEEEAAMVAWEEPAPRVRTYEPAPSPAASAPRAVPPRPIPQPIEEIEAQLEDIEPEPYLDEIEELRQQRRPPDLSALTAMPVILERIWEPSPVRAPLVDEPSKGFVPEGFEGIDSADVHDADDEAATIDEDLFSMDDAPPAQDPDRAGLIPPIVLREPHPVPAPLARPAPVPSSSSFLDFAPPRSFSSLAEAAPSVAAEDPVTLLAELRAELALDDRTVPPRETELEPEDQTSEEAPLPPRYLNSLGLTDREVVTILRKEHYPELEALDADALYELARVESEIMDHAADLGGVFGALVRSADSEDPQWLAAIWWSGVIGEKRVREALERLSTEPSDSTMRWLAWLVRPYLPEVIAARGSAEDRMGLIPALTRLERSLARRRALVRTGPPEMDRELGRYPVNPRGLHLRVGFRWLDP